MTPATASKPLRMPLLDGLRGIAAIAVVFHHEPGLYGSQSLFPRAYLAVDFFFMLSGFVLTLAYEPRLNRGLSPATFMLQRIARLWPVLAVGIFIGGLNEFFHVGGGVHSLIRLALTLLLIPAFNSFAIYRLNGPQWSISFELIANAAHALLLRRLSNTTLLGFGLLCGLVLAWQGVLWGKLASGDMVVNWWGGFARVGFSYTIGIWFGRQYQLERGTLRLGKFWWCAALPVPLVILTAQLWPLSPFAGDSLAVFVLLPLALWVAVQASPPARATPALSWLGQISYPIYAVHIPVLVFAARYIHRLSTDQQGMARAAALAFAFVLAWLLAISPLATGRWKPRTSKAPVKAKPGETRT